jgi:hypothetical protein
MNVFFALPFYLQSVQVHSANHVNIYTMAWRRGLLTFLCFSEWRKVLKRRHFDVLRQNCRWYWTPSQNTNSRMHLKWQKHWEWCIHVGGGCY